MLTFDRRRRSLESLLIHGAQLDLGAWEEMSGRILIILLRPPLIVGIPELRAPQNGVYVNPNVLVTLFEAACVDLICRLH